MIITQKEWNKMSAEQREIHYNRERKCGHQYDYKGIETAKGVFDKSDDRLREQYSFDPYAHTAHMEHCLRWEIPSPKRDSIECFCQMCANKIGISRDKAGG